MAKCEGMLIRFMALVISVYSYGSGSHTHWGYERDAKTVRM